MEYRFFVLKDFHANFILRDMKIRKKKHYRSINMLISLIYSIFLRETRKLPLIEIVKESMKTIFPENLIYNYL